MIEWVIRGVQNSTHTEQILPTAEGAPPPCDAVNEEITRLMEGKVPYIEVISRESRNFREDDPPYRLIARLLKEGKVVPFLGAAASSSARPPGTVWDLNTSDFPPTAVELSRHIADEINYPSENPREREDLARVTSYYACMAKQSELRNRLREIFLNVKRTGSIHRYLAKIESPMLIVTTNYDRLMEIAFEEVKKTNPAQKFDVVVQTKSAFFVKLDEDTDFRPCAAQDLGKIVDPKRRTIIYKMHGSIVENQVGFDRFVITEEDYMEFLLGMGEKRLPPACFMQHFAESSFLFLGYGLRDWNLRVLMQHLSRFLPVKREQSVALFEDGDEEETPHWAVQYFPARAECRLWRRRNVEIYHYELSGFIRDLEAGKRQ